jgi:Tol biopolymer transport system component
MVSLMSTIALAQLHAPSFITDPAQLSSQTKADVERLSIEKLFMTRALAGTAWSPDGKTVAFISNMSGRYNLWTVPADGGWPVQLTISDQRQYRPAWSPDGKWISYQSPHYSSPTHLGTFSVKVSQISRRLHGPGQTVEGGS